jgi:hypothetical protein
VAILGLLATIIICFGVWRLDKESVKFLTEVSGRYLSVQLITVQAVVLSVFVLGFLGNLPQDAIVAILSGIAGYVLGGVDGPSRAERRRPDEPRDSR